MKKTDIVKIICPTLNVQTNQAEAFAPSNIALCKYWGKRNNELNLPITSSLSISLGKKGAHIRLSTNPEKDVIILNGNSVHSSETFAQRLSAFLD
ncbi:MAG TPA: diphosphomevalonate decarboxylase, partial [Gammaproteobacteria bacterium]|nr:diphosphomevalonate decarboxylase [Gammaproteobacteria bacterium]